ncbi:MAG: methylated-DNA--[protein]-cysteine S-methyltransferase [Deltaproteobacteria bacterium]|nr:methylated-DNA--[protein]-cysteine S-methyltransferase [Deltaproteobacteria bacterium]
MADALGIARFPTALGVMGLAWSEAGLVATWLPEPRGEDTLRRMRRRFPRTPELAPPLAVARAIEAITALLRGERRDLREIALDLREVSALHRRIYEVARTIPPGKTLAYGEIAERLGDRALAREVGAAMARNRFAVVVPCHRVLGADGKLGGFSAPGGLETKLRLLSIEGVQMPGTLPLFASAPDRE